MTLLAVIVGLLVQFVPTVLPIVLLIVVVRSLRNVREELRVLRADVNRKVGDPGPSA